MSQGEVYAQATIDFCRRNNIRATKLTYLKLCELLSIVPEDFEFRELEQYHELILDYYEFFTLDVILLIYFDMHFNKKRRINKIVRVQSVEEKQNFIINLEPIFNDFVEDKDQQAIERYLSLTYDSMACNDVYIFADDYNSKYRFENVAFLIGQTSSTKKYGISLDLVNNNLSLPGDNDFLNKDEEKIRALFIIYNKYVFHSRLNTEIKQEVFLLSRDTIVEELEFFTENSINNKNVIQKFLSKQIIYMLKSYNGDINYEKVWGQFVYDIEFDFKLSSPLVIDFVIVMLKSVDIRMEMKEGYTKVKNLIKREGK